MKTCQLICRGFAAALALIVATSTFAFEGRVELKMTGKKQEEVMTMTHFIKGTLYRSEAQMPPDKKGKPGMTFVTIVNWDARELLTLMPEQKMYMATKLDDVEKMADDAAKKYQIEFKPTGRKETIAGYEAEEYVSVSENKKADRTEVWVTKGLGKFMMAQGKGAKAEAWQSFTQKGDFFTLRVVTRKKEGAPEEYRMEATKIEKGAQPDSLFKPPADYQRLETPSVKDIMKGMIPGVGR